MRTGVFQFLDRRVSRVWTGAAALFAAGWCAGRATLPAPEVSAGKDRAAAVASSHFSSAQKAPAAPSPLRGTFRDLLDAEKTLAARTTDEWQAAWREHIRHKNGWGLLEQWAKHDPHGALRTAVEAAGRLPAQNQEHYDHQALGHAAINQLFRQDPPAAIAAMREWAALYGAYPPLDCLHLLVTGSEAQKAVLRQFISAGDPVPFHYGTNGRLLEVAGLLSREGSGVRPEIAPALVRASAIQNPVETAEWFLQKTEPVPESLLNMILEEGSWKGRDKPLPPRAAEVFERLLEKASPGVADRLAATCAKLQAHHDPEAARRWAEEHVPEGELPKVLKEITAKEESP